MQKVKLRVIPRARQNKITTDADGTIRVHITAAPVDGAANDAVIRALADFFDVPKSQIKIVRGATSRDKVVELLWILVIQNRVHKFVGGATDIDLVIVQCFNKFIV